MEGLIAIVAELLLLPFIAGITALCEIIAAFLSLVLQFLLGTATHSTKLRITVPPIFIKWIRRVTLGTLVLSATALLLVNFVFLDKAIHFALHKVQSKTGFEIQYESVEANLFTGSFVFTGLNLRQSKPDKPQLSLQADHLAANLSVWDFIFGRRVVDHATLSHAEIQLQTLPKTEDKQKAIGFALSLGKKGLDAINLSKSPLLKLPNYTIKDLKLNDVRIHVGDRSTQTSTSYDIEIDHFQALPLRSHFAPFDLLFRSNLDGTLNGSRLEIINTEEDGQRHTKWATKNTSAATLASLIGGPFTLFETGSVDVEVSDRWESESAETLELDWKIKVTDATARLPQGTPKIIPPLVQVWVDNINQNQKDWEFAFQLQLSESQFRGASSLNAQQIWRDSITAFLQQATDLTGTESSTLKEKTESAIDAFKDYLKKRKANN